MNKITAMIVDDEAPMRAHLRSKLKQIWPELEIIAEAQNGIVAIEEAEKRHPQIIFLDIRMPGKNGIEAAAQLAENAILIFVTAYDEYAIQAFERGAMDYLLKPIDVERLQQTCLRLKQRVLEKLANTKNIEEEEKSTTKPNHQSQQVEQLLTQLMLQQAQQKDYLRWIQASVGTSLRMISTKEILFFKSDEKYTLVQTEQAEFLIRKTLKELEDELDPKEFWRIHRSTLVRVNAIAEVTRDFRGRQMLGLKGCSDKLEVSRNHTHLFQQM
ncbi:response regulator transcription factor [Undibacterium seohonense]|jgi:DNA-binding LytR/AlgR family response regulator|uniref:Response regulator transcription factor n=1 Tax=Undibacterium seohonense TaxID=1344950 RepID=A0ABR6X560_9BURK|nr:LytTR family DNA-binding domain-containing protein [Undibacterium seohonense]MBC3807715.1 response regulator transcription factor [Undibacterium seohonense]